MDKFLFQFVLVLVVFSQFSFLLKYHLINSIHEVHARKKTKYCYYYYSVFSCLRDELCHTKRHSARTIKRSSNFSNNFGILSLPTYKASRLNSLEKTIETESWNCEFLSLARLCVCFVRRFTFSLLHVCVCVYACETRLSINRPGRF